LVARDVWLLCEKLRFYYSIAHIGGEVNAGRNQLPAEKRCVTIRREA
jgi:hypothetical protein